MPSLLRAYSSKLRMAVLMVRGGGRTVRPILMALLLLESKTMISWRLPSAAVFWSIKIQTGGGGGVTAGSLFCSLLYFLRLVSQCGLVYGLVRIRNFNNVELHSQNEGKVNILCRNLSTTQCEFVQRPQDLFAIQTETCDCFFY